MNSPAVGCASVLASGATHGPNCAAPNPACKELLCI